MIFSPLRIRTSRRRITHSLHKTLVVYLAAAGAGVLLAFLEQKTVLVILVVVVTVSVSVSVSVMLLPFSSRNAIQAGNIYVVLTLTGPTRIVEVVVTVTGEVRRENNGVRSDGYSDLPVVAGGVCVVVPPPTVTVVVLRRSVGLTKDIV